MPKVILALPAYNEALAIGDLLEAARETFQTLDAAYAPSVIVVDDGSTDATAEIVERHRAPYPVRLIRHEKNRRLGPTLLSCLRAALESSDSDDDTIICMDADNTFPPATIPTMLERRSAGADLVIASRYCAGSRQRGVPLHRRALSAGARLLFTLRLRLPGVREYTAGFRSYGAGLLRRGFEAYGDALVTRESFACTNELLVNLARLAPPPRIVEVPFTLRYDRKRGESKIRIFKTIYETLKILAR